MTPIDICLLNWNTYNTRMQKTFDSLDDTRYSKPIAEGLNSPSWILGHLVETEDALLELYGIGKRLFPDLKQIYHHERGSNQTGLLPKDELIKRWKAVSAELDRAFKSWSESDWMGRHTAVTEDDFKREPHRNRLNVILNRLAHKASHLGQVAMMK